MHNLSEKFETRKLMVYLGLSGLGKRETNAKLVFSYWWYTAIFIKLLQNKIALFSWPIQSLQCKWHL